MLRITTELLVKNMYSINLNGNIKFIDKKDNQQQQKRSQLFIVPELIYIQKRLVLLFNVIFES